VVLASSSESFF